MSPRLIRRNNARLKNERRSKGGTFEREKRIFVQILLTRRLVRVCISGAHQCASYVKIVCTYLEQRKKILLDRSIFSNTFIIKTIEIVMVNPWIVCIFRNYVTLHDLLL